MSVTRKAKAGKSSSAARGTGGAKRPARKTTARKAAAGKTAAGKTRKARATKTSRRTATRAKKASPKRSAGKGKGGARKSRVAATRKPAPNALIITGGSAAAAHDGPSWAEIIAPAHAPADSISGGVHGSGGGVDE